MSVDNELKEVWKHAKSEAQWLKNEVDRLESMSADEKAPVDERLMAAGKIAELFGCNAHAKQIYELAMKIKPDTLEAMARRAILYLRTGQTEDGVALASELATRHPNFKFKNLGGNPTSILAVLGDAYRLQSDTIAAGKVFAKAIELEPADGYSQARYAEMLIMNDQLGEATKRISNIPDRAAWHGLKATLNAAIQDPDGVQYLVGMRAKTLRSREVV